MTRVKSHPRGGVAVGSAKLRARVAYACGISRPVDFTADVVVSRWQLRLEADPIGPFLGCRGRVERVLLYDRSETHLLVSVPVDVPVRRWLPVWVSWGDEPLLISDIQPWA